MLEYYGLKEIGLGLLEGVSFAESDTIKKQTERLTGIKIKGGTSVTTTLIDFEKICQFRRRCCRNKIKMKPAEGI